MHRVLSILILASVLTHAHAATVREFTRIRGQGESVLQGVGLVLGLNGTGDGGDELATIRPLAELLRRNEMPIATLEELANANSAALVMVTCTVPREGAQVDDTLDARVSVLNSASSLKGGELYIAPLTEPRPGGSVYGFAQGSVVIEDEENPTTGVVSRGVRIVRPIQTMPQIEGAFDLVVDNWYAGWSTTHYIASQINDSYHLNTDPTADRIARVIDDRTIRMLVPPAETDSRAAFISDVMQTLLDPKRFGLPAMVVANTRTGIVHFHEIPGQGSLDLAASFRALTEQGFDGYGAVELYHHVESWQQALEESHHHLAPLTDERNGRQD